MELVALLGFMYPPFIMELVALFSSCMYCLVGVLDEQLLESSPDNLSRLSHSGMATWSTSYSKTKPF
jgi:hypothetical protein